MINQASRPGLCRVRSVVALVIAILTSVVAVVPVPARAGAEVFASIGTGETNGIYYPVARRSAGSSTGI
jgi:TRAP-type uncharacterized transport system substrate-binding protein